jgi:hypothetical protein
VSKPLALEFGRWLCSLWANEAAVCVRVLALEFGRCAVVSSGTEVAEEKRPRAIGRVRRHLVEWSWERAAAGGVAMERRLAER